MTSIFRSFLIASGVLAAFTLVQPAVHAQGFGGAFATFFSNDADEDEDDHPVDVSASSADIDFEKNLITLMENVIVDRSDVKITCEKMEIFLKEKTEEPEEEEEAEEQEAPEVKPAAVSVADQAAAGKKGDDKEAKKDDNKDGGMNQSSSRIVCSRNVVYRQQKSNNPMEDSLALAAKGDYDEATGVIVMTGGHKNPEEELPEAMYNDIVRVVGKDMIREYPIMKQGTDWIVGDRIEILGKKRMRIINPKATRSSKAAAATPSNTRTGSTR